MFSIDEFFSVHCLYDLKITTVCFRDATRNRYSRVEVIEETLVTDLPILGQDNVE